MGLSNAPCHGKAALRRSEESPKACFWQAIDGSKIALQELKRLELNMGIEGK